MLVVVSDECTIDVVLVDDPERERQRNLKSQRATQPQFRSEEDQICCCLSNAKAPGATKLLFGGHDGQKVGAEHCPAE